MIRLTLATILGLSIFMMSCHSTSKDGYLQESLTRYSDIDLYTLTGIGKVEGEKYPFITVDLVDQNTKRIIFFNSNRDLDTDIFKRNTFGWFRIYTSSIDTAMLTTIENIHNGKIEWLDYVGEGTSSMKIYSVRWFDKGQKYKYSLRDPIKVKFGVWDSSILKKPMITIAESDYSVTGGVLREINTDHDFIDNTIREIRFVIIWKRTQFLGGSFLEIL